MSCILTDGGIKAIFPLRRNQIDSLLGRAAERAVQRKIGVDRLEQRFGVTMKPDGAAFYVVTYAPPTPSDNTWEGFFFTELGPCELYGRVGADPGTGIVNVEAAVTVSAPSTGVRVAVSWRVHGPAATSTASNVAGLLLETRIENQGPHDERCLRDCIALHAPECVPMKRGNESQLVAAIAAVAASCLVNCRC
jgi:hypothetical protein